MWRKIVIERLELFQAQSSIQTISSSEQEMNTKKYKMQATCHNCKKFFPIEIEKGTSTSNSFIECPYCGKKSHIGKGFSFRRPK